MELAKNLKKKKSITKMNHYLAFFSCTSLFIPGNCFLSLGTSSVLVASGLWLNIIQRALITDILVCEENDE